MREPCVAAAGRSQSRDVMAVHLLFWELENHLKSPKDAAYTLRITTNQCRPREDRQRSPLSRELHYGLRLCPLPPWPLAGLPHWAHGSAWARRGMNTHCYSVAMDLGVCHLRNLSISFLSSVLGRESASVRLDSSSGTSVVAIDNKIEQAMDLVKSHLMYAVREEVEVLKEQIKELIERNSLLEQENTLLKTLASPEQMAQFQAQPGPRPHCRHHRTRACRRDVDHFRQCWIREPKNSRTVKRSRRQR
uniref:Uncharacterized protein n=1 Tax=Knipowitschia caucasica TaxID=637954 RepID=A0AAV2L7X7_KNICA